MTRSILGLALLASVVGVGCVKVEPTAPIQVVTTDTVVITHHDTVTHTDSMTDTVRAPINGVWVLNHSSYMVGLALYNGQFGNVYYTGQSDIDSHGVFIPAASGNYTAHLVYQTTSKAAQFSLLTPSMVVVTDTTITIYQ